MRSSTRPTRASASANSSENTLESAWLASLLYSRSSALITSAERCRNSMFVELNISTKGRARGSASSLSPSLSSSSLIATTRRRGCDDDAAAFGRAATSPATSVVPSGRCRSPSCSASGCGVPSLCCRAPPSFAGHCFSYSASAAVPTRWRRGSVVVSPARQSTLYWRLVPSPLCERIRSAKWLCPLTAHVGQNHSCSGTASSAGSRQRRW